MFTIGDGMYLRCLCPTGADASGQRLASNLFT